MQQGTQKDTGNPILLSDLTTVIIALYWPFVNLSHNAIFYNNVISFIQNYILRYNLSQNEARDRKFAIATQLEAVQGITQ